MRDQRSMQGRGKEKGGGAVSLCSSLLLFSLSFSLLSRARELLFSLSYRDTHRFFSFAVSKREDGGGVGKGRARESDLAFSLSLLSSAIPPSKIFSK